jgi:7-cyano-7-deazaguanine reductase
MSDKAIQSSQLGKKTNYSDKYDRTILYPISRKSQDNAVQMHGYDLWNMYELSWLNPNGKPEVAIGNIIYDASSSKLIESKSLKLYLNSFNNSKFNNIQSLAEIIEKDLSNALETRVLAKLWKLNSDLEVKIANPEGLCIDDLDISIESFNFENRHNLINNLILSNTIVSETLYSNLLRSNCPITNQPDWGTLTIKYTGKQISKTKLLEYILAYRNHNDFHEHCVENIFTELMTNCNPSKLIVYANYTRRGGIDINPYRSSHENQDLEKIILNRLVRQ